MGLAGLYQYTALVKRAYNEQEFPTQTGKHLAIRKPVQSEVGSRRWRFTQGTLIYLPLAILLALTIYDSVRALRMKSTGFTLPDSAHCYCWCACRYPLLVSDKREQ